MLKKKKQIKQLPASHFIPLDEEERQLAEDLEKGLYSSASSPEELQKTINMFREAAEAYDAANETKHVTFRLNKLDIMKVKSKASRSHLPYQTLIGMLIHKYANDELQMVI